MGAPILTTAATVLCGHGGTATWSPGQHRVLAGGQPMTLVSDLLPVSGCALSTSSGPFDTVLTWITPATRVFAGQVPVLLATSLPMGVGPGVVTAVQGRVTGQ